MEFCGIFMPGSKNMAFVRNKERRKYFIKEKFHCRENDKGPRTKTLTRSQVCNQPRLFFNVREEETQVFPLFNVLQKLEAAISVLLSEISCFFDIR